VEQAAAHAFSSRNLIKLREISSHTLNPHAVALGMAVLRLDDADHRLDDLEMALQDHLTRRVETVHHGVEGLAELGHFVLALHGHSPRKISLADLAGSEGHSLERPERRLEDHDDEEDHEEEPG
jgi:hypothetical protein